MTLLLEGKVEDTSWAPSRCCCGRRNAEERPASPSATRHPQAPRIAVDLDWPTYAGKKRHLPWYLGRQMPGRQWYSHPDAWRGAHTAGRLSEQLLDRAYPLCRDWAAVDTALGQHQLAFSPCTTGRRNCSA